ncbi:MAG: response regulator [Oscillospiraceae bacterium]|nr:response regulator [Oscillospiraceae bacterium]
MQKTIFVVDDNDTNLSVAKEALKEHYRVMTLPSAAKMFALLEKIKPDLILLDIEMPEMDGFQALQRLKDSRNSDIPVIFLTSMTDPAVEARGFEMGVIDFVTKPFSAPVLQNRMKTHLNIDELIRERTAQLQKLQNAIVFVIADVVESRDENTGGHIERTSTYMRILVDAMLKKGVYADELSQIDLDLMIDSARMHDVGKISISDTILNKPGKLTDEEFSIMKTHTVEGEKVIDQIIARTGGVEFLRNARMFAGSHHERWDGRGYPNNTVGADIPIQGRIMSVVDVYDALVSERPYKKPFTHDEATKIIMDGAGTQFDPNILNVFFEIRDKFAEVEL